ncbi:MAG: hypothetical protein ACI87J_002550 [Colwellia sp.]|jgi:hypothetical protein
MKQLDNIIAILLNLFILLILVFTIIFTLSQVKLISLPYWFDEWVPLSLSEAEIETGTEELKQGDESRRLTPSNLTQQRRGDDFVFKRDNALEENASESDLPETFKLKISGTVHYDRLHFMDKNPFQVRKSANIKTYQLETDKPEKFPARSIEVSLIAGEHTLDTTQTDEQGHYSFSNYNLYPELPHQVIVKAKLTLDATIWNSMKVSVRDPSRQNMQGEPIIYSASSESFIPSEQDVERNFHFKAELIDEWQSDITSQYKSQPLAILDTIKKAADYFSAEGVPAPEHKLKDLKIYWSQNPGEKNVIHSAAGAFISRKDRDSIIYLSSGEAPLVPWKGQRVISEWSEGVIIHEFGHFILKHFIGRNDSMGGGHTALGKASLPLALSEGFANMLAYASLGSGQFRFAYVGNSKQSSSRDFLHCDLAREQDELGNFIYEHSPFAETTVSWYLLSLIDSEFNCHDTLMADLPSAIGLKGVITALQEVKNKEPLITIYSLSESLIELFPTQKGKVIELGKSMGMTLGNAWGEEEVPMMAISGWSHRAGIPEESYLPLYVNVWPSYTSSLVFNGGLYPSSVRRPGTIRYGRLIADAGKLILLKVYDAQDTQGRRHSFSFDVVYAGKRLETSHYLSQRGYSYAYVTLPERGFRQKQAVIRIFNERYANPSPDSNNNVNETILTKISASYEK